VPRWRRPAGSGHRFVEAAQENTATFEQWRWKTAIAASRSPRLAACTAADSPVSNAFTVRRMSASVATKCSSVSCAVRSWRRLAA
jgi:hypothetical protein